MLKAKAVIKFEFEQDKIPSDWRGYLEAFFSTLDGAMVHFGSESRGVMRVKSVRIEGSKEGKSAKAKRKQ